MSKSGFKWTYFVMTIVAVFATWVYFNEYKGGEAREKAKADASALLPFSNSNVIEIAIRSMAPDGAVMSETLAKKTGDFWNIEKPYADLGDSAAVDSFLSSLSTEKTLETVVEAVDIAWKTYGLDRPIIEATFLAKPGADGPSKRSIVIGSVPAFDGSIYARLDGENRVVLLGSTARAVLQKDPRDLRDKHFFPSKSKEPRKFKALEISRPGFPKVSLNKKDEVWVQQDGKADAWPLDQGAVKAYVDAVIALRGNDIWAEDGRDLGLQRLRKLDKPGLTISLRSETDEKFDLRIAPLAKAESVAAGVGSVRPQVFSVYKAQIELLSKTIDDFRDLKFPFQFKIADVRAIELERPPGAVSLPVLVKKDGKWIIDPVDTRFSGREVKSELVDRLMAEITSLAAAKVSPSLVPKPKLGPKGSVRIAMFADKSAKIIELIFNLSGESVHVSSSVAPGKVFEMEQALLNALTLDVLTPPPGAPPLPSSGAPQATPPGAVPSEKSPP